MVSTKWLPRVRFSYDEYSSLPTEIRQYVWVSVENNTDTMTDYFDNDHFELYTWDERFLEALSACIDKEQKYYNRQKKKQWYRRFGLETIIKKIDEMQALYTKTKYPPTHIECADEKDWQESYCCGAKIRMGLCTECKEHC
jgi:hypothetical protein